MRFQSLFSACFPLAIACAACLALGCGDDAPQVTPDQAFTPPPTAVPAVVSDLGEELTPIQQQQLKAQFATEAATEITADNAEAMAAKLEQEIDAELAAE
jgi:hypothetical protein